MDDMKIFKSNSTLVVALLVLFSIGFNSCKDNKDDEDAMTPGAPGASEQDEDFVISASYANIAELRLSELAVQKATNDSVAAFAKRMITDHTSAQNDLKSISSNLKISMNDSLDQVHRSLYNRLSGLKGYTFDSTYINNQVLDHQTTKTLLETMIANKGDSSLVAYASKRLTMVNSHLQNAIDTRTRLNQNRGK